MKFVCLKCGFEAKYFGRGRYRTCQNCLTYQPIRPIEAAIWVYKGMPKING
jgi:lipopolysaccharide biosynthesis regulator YciM